MVVEVYKVPVELTGDMDFFVGNYYRVYTMNNRLMRMYRALISFHLD